MPKGHHDSTEFNVLHGVFNYRDSYVQKKVHYNRGIIL